MVRGGESSRKLRDMPNAKLKGLSWARVEQELPRTANSDSFPGNELA